MNTDQRRALKQLKEMYPEREHEALEKNFRKFLSEEESKYNTPIDLTEGFIIWVRRRDVNEH